MINLSILIPTYNAHHIALKLIENLALSKRNDIEIIIADDSDTRELEYFFKNNNFTFIKYIKNKKNLGAIKNWNYLISMSAGRYIWLLHQDEIPHDIDLIVSKILKFKASDIFIMPVIVRKSTIMNISLSMLHATSSTARKVLNKPKLLFYFNCIGAPSALIAKREIYEKYDESLKWLVDVELYYRIFSKKEIHFKYLEDCPITSIESKSSITSSIDSKKKIFLSEIKLIAKKHKIKFTFFDRVISLLQKIKNKIITIKSLRLL